MITFTTPTELPIEAATTMGVSVKESDSAIGKFGTGLKYAIAGILRLNGDVTIYIKGDHPDEFEFTKRRTEIRGRWFELVCCNDQPCGFTTELGKHWEPWQIFRELASNTLDEGGEWAHGEAEGMTAIKVSCREVEEAERAGQVFIGDRKPLLKSNDGAQIYEGPTQHYYFRGIRAGSFDCIAPVTVDVHDGSLSEDRLLDLAKVRSELSWAFRTAVSWCDDFILSVIRQKDRSDFWVRHVDDYHITEMPSRMMGFLAERRKFTKHPAFKGALEAHLKSQSGNRWEPIELTAQHRALIERGESLCSAVGVDPIPSGHVRFTRDLGDNQIAVTCMDTREVWFSTKAVMLGRDEFLAAYLEEALHAMTGFGDCTRDLQNALLAIIVNNAEAA